MSNSSSGASVGKSVVRIVLIVAGLFGLLLAFNADANVPGIILSLVLILAAMLAK